MYLINSVYNTWLAKHGRQVGDPRRTQTSVWNGYFSGKRIASERVIWRVITMVPLCSRIISWKDCFPWQWSKQHADPLLSNIAYSINEIPHINSKAMNYISDLFQNVYVVPEWNPGVAMGLLTEPHNNGVMIWLPKRNSGWQPQQFSSQAGKDGIQALIFSHISQWLMELRQLRNYEESDCGTKAHMLIQNNIINGANNGLYTSFMWSAKLVFEHILSNWYFPFSSTVYIKVA